MSSPNRIMLSESQHSLRIAVLLRMAFMALLVYAVAEVVELGTRPSIILCAAIVGVFVSTQIVKTSLTSRGFIAICLVLYLLFTLLFALLNSIVPISHQNTFAIYLFEKHSEISLAAFMVAAISTWCFFRFKHVVTLEVLAIFALIVTFLSGHRNYHLDTPILMNSLAWSIGVRPQFVLVGTAGIAIILGLLYFLTARGSGNEHRNTAFSYGRYSIIGTIIGILGLLITIVMVGQGVLMTYTVEKGLVSNGVGEKSEAGESPLGFHSALGSTSQPAALVRLDGDYSYNPFSPMLYMREGALSEYNGHEMVIAPAPYDNDVSKTSPTESYFGTEDSTLINRFSIAQSVYLLSDQRNAFAIDYPLQIKLLQNPDPARFRAAYQAISLAPTYKLEELKYDRIGDPRWSKEVLNHYLVTNSDPRYQQLALRLSSDYAAPIEKAAAIVQYLSKNSIYTLTPNHEVDPSSDQTAPYIFGDLRGYCVHFAHATVYMLRALGIPSRIGTGFLTDLKDSKDGHILLRMSDRHAWAEVYVESRGWVPFDTQPEQVENAADSQIDMKLLEELMQKLEPGSEILPDSLLKDEENVFEPDRLSLPNKRHLIIGALILIAFFFSLKLYLRYSWILGISPGSRIRRSYIAFAARLYDNGVWRQSTETRREFSERLRSALGVSELEMVPLLERAGYRTSNDLTRSLIDKGRSNDFKKLLKLPRWKRVLSVLNPNSVLAFLWGHRW